MHKVIHIVSQLSSLSILDISNNNLSGAQKKLILWHLELGISMSCVQRLTRVSEMYGPNGSVAVKDGMIVPKINAAASCEILKCVSCNLSLVVVSLWK